MIRARTFSSLAFVTLAFGLAVSLGAFGSGGAGPGGGSIVGVVASIAGERPARAQTASRPSGPARPERPSPPSSVSAAAGGAPIAGKPVEADTPKVKVERGIGGKKVYRITEEIRIEGKIQKPEAFFFYQKSSINYDWQELKQDFIPRILDSVNQSPF